MKQKTAQKPYWEMTSDELAEATKEFDRAIPLSKTKPLTKAQRANFERMRRSPHRSVYVSRNGDRVLVRLDPELLRRSSRYAAEQNLTLSEVINRSLKGMLAIVETAPGAPRRESKRKKAS
jgi:hypothetical protein